MGGGIHRNGELENGCHICGQLIFVKSNSLIFENKRCYDNDKLLIKRPVNY